MRALLLLFTVLPMLASAQVPNGSFENWGDQGGYSDPVGWLTYDGTITPGGWPLSTVEPGTPGEPGNYHCMITTQQVPLGPAIQGWISAGTSATHPGFPYTGRPTMLTGQWQYGIEPNDTAQVTVALINGANQTFIAAGVLEITGSLSNWQTFQVPLTYFSSEEPDTAYIQIVSSYNVSAPVVGSFVKVDDLAFSGTVGIGEFTASNTLSIFPNPGTTHFTLDVPPGPHTITLCDATGRVLLEQRTTDGRPVIGTEALPAGLYRVTVRDERGGVQGAMWMKAD
jgi:hypothetical protein